ncbi:MAG TPA: hypothetical protein VGI19_12710 [Candidatus Cybelea sp.]|jgi:hypothetical protein
MSEANAGCILLALCLALQSNAAADPSAYQIFEHARRVLQAQSYPDPIFYRTTIHVSERAKDEFEHFHGQASGADVRVEGISDEEQGAPHESSGVNFKVSFSIGWNTGAGGQTETDTQDAHRKEASPDYLGVPLISPAYSFGLTSRETRSAKPSPGGASDLPTIATVTAIGRAYDVSLVGTDTVEGLYTYHLHLQPTIHPDRNRIRELWVDVYTFQIVRLQTQGNFTSAPMSNVPWLVSFQTVDGNTYVKDETALEPLVFPHDRTFSTASISFDDIRATDNSPPILPSVDGHASVNLREPDSPR